MQNCFNKIYVPTVTWKKKTDKKVSTDYFPIPSNGALSPTRLNYLAISLSSINKMCQCGLKHQGHNRSFVEDLNLYMKSTVKISFLTRARSFCDRVPFAFHPHSVTWGIHYRQGASVLNASRGTGQKKERHRTECGWNANGKERKRYFYCKKTEEWCRRKTTSQKKDYFE